MTLPSERRSRCTLICRTSLIICPSTLQGSRLRLADGSERVVDRKAGDAFWGDAVTHSVENLGETEIHNLIVELKDGGHESSSRP
jgi:hypothetical protein